MLLLGLKSAIKKAPLIAVPFEKKVKRLTMLRHIWNHFCFISTFIQFFLCFSKGL